MKLSNFTKHVLFNAGWQPGADFRHIVAHWKDALSQSDGWAMFPAAEQALREFGPLRVQQYAPGVTCAREPFEFDPLLNIYDKERFDAYAEDAQTALYSLGECAGRRGQLAIGANGQVFSILDDLALEGENIYDALNNLVEGHASQLIYPR